MACDAQLLNNRATSFPIRAALYSVQLCRGNAVNADWSILVYATKLQCATPTRHVTFATKSREKIDGVRDCLHFKYKKLNYRRETTRRSVSVEILSTAVYTNNANVSHVY